MSSSKTSTTSPIQSPISPSKPSPLTSTSSTNVNSDLSTSDLIERIPTPILRLLAITSPLIDSIHSLIHLLTWNQSNSKSILLLLSWWSICLFSYELLRFAPQVLLLSFISYQGIVKFYSSSKGNRSNPSNGRKIVTNKSINQTLVKLTEITDFFSTLKINLIHPILDLLSWKNNQTTKRFSFFLLTTWPLWLICFLPFNGGNIIPNLWFKIEFSWFGNLISWGWQRIHLLLVDLELKNKAIELLSSKAPHLYNALISFSNSASQIFHSHHVQQVLNFTSSTFKFLISTLFFHNSSNGTSNLSIPLFPPFPFFSLTLRHFFLISGTFILTYCSPWSALIRHSLWKSSLIRRSTRAFIRIFTLQSGSIGGGNQNFNRYLDDDTTDLFGLNENARYKAFDDDEIRDLDARSAKNEKKSQGKSKPVQESKVTRHEDVIYQFSIFENQRWWMGLDWTAALLPQERPSWSDESNNPVSPPSSFSLPSAKISITPSPSNSISSSSKKLFNRRLVKWQWLDPEWTVSGAGFVSSTVYNNATNGSASNSSGYLGDALSRMRATKSAGYEQTSFPSSSSQNTLFSNSQKDETSSTTSTSEREDFINSDVSSVNGAELSVDILDVDSEGWQYGDNSWEKLSKKSGLGRYTRRRKWVRRAVLVEILERDVELSEKELKDYERENGVSGDGGLIAVGSGNGNDEDEGDDTETENEVEEKVNKLKSNPIDGDIDSNLNENLARKSVDNTVSNSSNANVGAVGIGNSGLNGGNEKRASGDLQSRLAKLTK